MIERGQPRVADLRLENGLRLFCEPDHRLPLVVLHCCYLVGARFDPPKRGGLAHLCEHLAYEGRASPVAAGFPDRVERAGGVARASTFHDRTVYTASLPSHQLALGLELEERRLSEPPSGPEVIEVQRRVLLQEYRQRVENRPYGQCFKLLQEALYPPDHPYHRPPVGSPRGFKAVTEDDVETFFQRYYDPARVIAVVAGDASLDECRRLCESVLGALQGRAPLAEDPPSTLGPPSGSRRRRVTDRVPFPRAYLAFRMPGAHQPGYLEAALWIRSLALGRTSFLHRRLVVEKAVAQDVQSVLVPMRQASTAALVATAAAGVGADELEEALLAGVEAATVDGVPERALHRARQKALTDYYWRMQRPEYRAEQLATAVAFGQPPGQSASEAERITGVTPEALAEVGHRHAGRHALLSIVPRETVQ